jgi:hypothetical protein
MPLGGLRSVYIAHEVQHEPLDQTDLKDGVDAILGDGRGIFQKILMRGTHGGPSVTMVGSASGVVSWSPLESSRVVFVVVKFSFFSHFDPSF